MNALKNDGILGMRNVLCAYVNSKKEPLTMNSMPLIVQIEPTTLCNITCQMCVNPQIKRQRRHMLFKEFKEIVDGLSLVRKISLTGAGEPLLNPGIFAMLDYAKSKNILIGLSTNGMLLNAENIRKITDINIDWINISLDAATAKTYESIRRGANFEILISNIKPLTEAMKRRRGIISLWFVVMKNNFQELPQVVSIAEKIAVKKITVALGHDFGLESLRNDVFDDNYSVVTEKLIPIQSVLKTAKNLANHKKIVLNCVNVPNQAGRRTCKWPWTSCYITVEGFVVPCCMRGADPEVSNFGNIFKDTFIDIWNNSCYQDFRRELRSDVIPQYCKGCPSYYQSLII